VPQARLASLGNEVRKHRGNKTLRESARTIGISPATLMRVESGRVPDVETFGKLCIWLGVDPRGYLGMKAPSPDLPAGSTDTKSTHMVMSAHFKADRLPDPETVKALANMIMYAAELQRQRSAVSNGDT
jgi:transcriptional regulator with XRE-family HTH domain